MEYLSLRPRKPLAKLAELENRQQYQNDERDQVVEATAF